MWVGVLLLLSPLMIFAKAACFPVSTPVPAGADAPGRAIATMVRGIISFTRWPAQPDPMQFCLLGPTRMTDGDLDTLSAGGRGVRVTRVPEGAASVPASCDTLYLGTVPPQRLSRLIAQGHERPLLTIAEEDAACRGGTMFCLHVRRSDISFELNLDAVSRSGVTVDPRVLRLSSGATR